MNEVNTQEDRAPRLRWPLDIQQTSYEGRKVVVLRDLRNRMRSAT